MSKYDIGYVQRIEENNDQRKFLTGPVAEKKNRETLGGHGKKA